jgi:hypothetical protein
MRQLAGGSRESRRNAAEIIEQLWQGRDIDEARELSELEWTQIQYLGEQTPWGHFSDDDLYADVQPVCPPYALILNDDLPLIVSDAIENQKRHAGTKYIPGKQLLVEDFVWVELYVTAQGTQMRSLKYGGVKMKKELASGEDEYWFKQPKDLFRPCRLTPIGSLLIPEPLFDWDRKGGWFRRLIKRYPDAQDMSTAVEGFSWEQFAKVAPYLNADLLLEYPLVAIDDSGEEPRFKIFSSLQRLQHFPDP